MSGRTVLVLGGGVGGVVAANRLRARLPRGDRILLIDREAHHLFQPSLLWLATGQRTAASIQRPLARLERRGIEVVHGAIEAIDATQRMVTVSGRNLTGDAIIVSLGAELAPEAIPGLAEAGHNLYAILGAERIRDELRSLRSGRVVVLTAAPAYKCPAAPYEAAMLIEALLRHRGVRPAVEVAMYAAEPGPMGVAGPAVSAGVRQMVESHGIRYYPDHQIIAADPATRLLRFASGATASFDLLVFIPPHRAPAAVRTSRLAGETGWISVDRASFATSFDGVFAIGDVTTVPLAMGKPLPKAGVFAHRQAEVVAGNIARAWTGKGHPQAFDGQGECFVETGDGRAGFGAGNFYAEPTPEVVLRRPSRWWHWGKVLFEWRWFRQWL
ncbi:MAG: NAD(P)/FAD-dependent oxidoreductase [Gemmatimonadales bacterium]